MSAETPSACLGCGTFRKKGRLHQKEASEAAVGPALRAILFDEVSMLRDRQVPKWYRGALFIAEPTESVDVAHEVLHGHIPTSRSEVGPVTEWSNAGRLKLASLSPSGEGYALRATRESQREQHLPLVETEDSQSSRAWSPAAAPGGDSEAPANQATRQLSCAILKT